MNHQIVNPEFDARHAGDVSVEAAETYIRAALCCLASDRAAALASLDDMFRAGRPPQGLSGRYQGEMLVVDIAPVITTFVTNLQERYRLWQGKRFDPATNSGDNILSNRARTPFGLFLPLYRGRRPDTAATFRALQFRTYIAPALFDATSEATTPVLKIDYDIPGNPSLTIRRVLDELVELADGYYLGRAYVRWWGLGWRRVAYFSLRLDSK